MSLAQTCTKSFEFYPTHLGIEKLIRAETVNLDARLAYATNPGNLRLELADFAPMEQVPAKSSATEIEIE